MAAETVFVDTNIFLYSTDTDSTFHAASNSALSGLRSRGVILATSTRVIAEYVSVARRIGEVQSTSGSASITLSKILSNANLIVKSVELLAETAAVTDCLLGLLTEYPAASRRVYDTCIVATMLVNGIGQILTANGEDFMAFSSKIKVDRLQDYTG